MLTWTRLMFTLVVLASLTTQSTRPIIMESISIIIKVSKRMSLLSDLRPL
jgi:hypothetical protein